MFVRTLIILSLFPVLLNAAESGPIRKNAPNLQAPLDSKFFDVNRIGSWITNAGEFVSARVNGGNSAMFWPRGGNKTLNYQSGIWIAGLVDDEIRTAAAEYSSEFTPGTVKDWNDITRADDFRIYVIDKSSGPGDKDYDEWPFADGAPADEFGKPKLFGDKTYWSVFSDMASDRHIPLFGTGSLGIEVRQTLWGYNSSGGLGDMMFMRYELLNAGANTLVDTYFSFWADIDLGDSKDLVASDTLLSLGYHYETADDVVYGSATPAIGYDLFQGPIVPSPGDTAISFWKQRPGYRNLPMTSFVHFARGGEPWEKDPETASDVYNYMRGFDRLGNPRLDDLGNVTRFSLTGDPVAGTGWLPTDRQDYRFLLTTGPFTMLPGDSQEVFAAVIIAVGTSALNSVTELKAMDSLAQVLFDSDIGVGIDDDKIFAPSGWSLEQNYPNPFNPVTTIEYSLQRRSDVSLVIYNLMGQEVARLVDGEQAAGAHAVTWNATKLSSGIYFYRLQAGDFVRTRKMLLLK